MKEKSYSVEGYRLDVRKNDVLITQGTIEESCVVISKDQLGLLIAQLQEVLAQRAESQE